jgi:hypothetical protein
VQFKCEGHEEASRHAAARESRRQKVEQELAAHPDHRYAFDVADSPLKAEPGEPVSVVLGLRHGAEILSAEVLIPRERWDMAAFLALMDAPERTQ